ncbi:MAG: ribonuclease HII [Gammaproteobacteria bacterium]|nr:MAG: ribonuclease HII [Gammaproteobacteria bacterium]RLA15240.1 MAG: ribonuclease HII [Gammaproteobacteria bacterium]RLA17574.1 MAG: ribonuclease HII [Gammaproteobacteria bacterium]
MAGPLVESPGSTLNYTAGVDEAGRGPLAGPVVSAAVILDPNHPIAGLADSKKLSSAQRSRLEVEIHQHALCYALGRADVEEIDELNILWATMLSMQRAIAGLELTADQILIDGNRVPKGLRNAVAVVRGDQTEPAISAASILAKQARDREMAELAQQYPGYGLEIHKGYPTKMHLTALKKQGPAAIHRRSFGPVKRLLGENS